MQPELDQRLGWRWLLPDDDSGPTVLYGFDEEEVAVLTGTRRTSSSIDGAIPGSVVIINADCESLEPATCASRIESARAVALIGRSPRLERWRGQLAEFADVRDYGLLPSSQPRVVVPLARRRWTRESLVLHRPGRPVARAAVALARCLTWVGLAGPLFRRRLRIARRRVEAAAVRQFASADFGQPHAARDCDFALYLGSADENRKTVVLPLGPRAPDRIIKIGQTAAARASLQREADNLRALAQSTLADRVPRLLGFRVDEQEAALCIEYRRRRFARELRIREAAERFLAALGARDMMEIPLSKWLDEEGLVLAVSRTETIKSVFDDVASQGRALRLQRVHGDFAPWNCAWTDAGFFAFDWEESRPLQLAFSDAYSYVIAPALLLDRGADPGRVVDNGLDCARRVAERMSLPTDQLPLHLAAWLLIRATKQPDPMLDALMAEVAKRIK